jgi:uncharacterized membrane protein YfcA
MTSLHLLLLLAATGLGAFAQRTTGIGFALLVAPMCALALDANTALGTVVRLAIVADVVVLVGDRGAVAWRSVATYLMPAALAFPVALIVSAAVSSQALVVSAAVITAGAAVVLFRARPAAVPSPAGMTSTSTRVAAFAAGFMGVTTGMSGPPLALQATLSGRALATDRATMTALFLVIDLAALVAHPHGVGGPPLAALVVALGLGAGAGGWAVSRLRDAHLRRLIPPLVLASACAAVARVLG